MRETRMKRGKRERVPARPVLPAIGAQDGTFFRAAVIACAVYLALEMVFLAGSQPLIAQPAPQTAGVRLEAGIEKEDVDGDLRSAMDIYQKIAADTSAPRDVRAKALLRLAGCDEKLGRQAKQIYEQIVHDYADEPAAANARKRLAAIELLEHPAPPATMSLRKIEWAGLGPMGGTDTDGERAVYWSAGHLYFGDLAGHNRHLIGNFKKFGSAPSRDFSLVALNLKADSSRHHKLAVIKIDGTGYRELICDDSSNSIFGTTSSFNMTWSWDDKYIEISDFDPLSSRHGQVWIVSVANGQHRVLVDQGDAYVRKAVFSPNGQYVAYEAWPRNDRVDQTSRVFVVPVEGGKPRIAFESAPWAPGYTIMSLMDWTADGRYLAVHDVRQGKSALYVQPIKGGAAGGEAAFVRYGEFDDGYTTVDGALVFQDNTVRPKNVSISLALIDADGHLGAWRFLDLNAHQNPWPSFSPDGSQIAYVGLAPDPARRSLFVRDLATGHDREIYQSAGGPLLCQYSIHSPRVFCSFESDEGVTELFSVEVESGAVEQIATFSEPRYLVRCGWDDGTFYFSTNGWRWGSLDPPTIEWNRSTGRETVIARDRDDFQMPSPDGRSTVGLRDGILSVRPSSGGDWMPLVSGITAEFPVFATPDGEWVLYQDHDVGWKISLFRVPIAGGKPQRMGDPPSSLAYGDFFFSADGHQVLAWGENTIELWLLENFEPSAKK
jgi:Tol biopolymer transport system component